MFIARGDLVVDGRQVYEQGELVPASDPHLSAWLASGEAVAKTTGPRSPFTPDGAYDPADSSVFPSRSQVRRLAALSASYPRAMASPPAGAVSAPNAASTITGAVAVAWSDPRIRLACGKWEGAAGDGFAQVANCTGADWDQQTYGEIEFGWHGQKIDIRILASSTVGRMRVRVNGEYVALTALPVNAGDGNVYNIAYDFGAAGLRHVVVETCQLGFVGLNVEPTASLFVPQPRSTRALFLGDSYTQLTGASETVINGFPLEVCRRLGWDEPWLCGEGATGYVSDAAGTGFPGRKKYGDRLAADVYSAKPDVVVILGSINDVGTPAAQIQAAAEAVYADYTANAPAGLAGYAPRLYVVGCQQPSGSPSAEQTATNDAIRAACAKYSVPFIDPTGWITGTGRSGAAASDGNADLFTGADGIHPTDAGHLYLGRRIAAAIAALDLGRVA